MDEGFEINEVNEATVDKNIELVDKAKVEKAKEEAKDDTPSVEIHKGGDLFCQRCGHNTTMSTVEVSTEDKESFLAAVLGNTYYVKEVSVMGGAITATLTTRPAWFSDAVKDQLITDQRNQSINSIDEFKLMMHRYYLLSDLKELKINGETKYTRPEGLFDPKGDTATKNPDNDNTKIPDLFKALMLNWSDVVLSALLDVEARFIMEIDVLTRHSNDPDFWQSATQH